MEEQEDKLAKWAGFQWLKATDGEYHWFDANNDIVSPTDEEGNVIWDMNALFKWLVPKLVSGDLYIELYITAEDTAVAIKRATSTVSFVCQLNPALALCLAIAKLIDTGEYWRIVSRIK